MKKTVQPLIAIILLVSFGVVCSMHAQVPGIINYQGRVTVGGTNFNGTGQFKFALVDGTGATTYWSNGVNVVSLPVTKGLYSILLGDSTIANMDAAIPSTVFTNADVRLRVWFDDGVSGLQQLSPDQRIAAVGYTLMAGNVPDGLITSNKVAAGAIGSGQLAESAVTSSKLASNLTVSGTLMANNFVGSGAGLTGIGGGQVLGGDLAVTRLNVGTGNSLSGELATIAGGLSNTASGVHAAVGGGRHNIASEIDATVSGGSDNTAFAPGAFIGGGGANFAGNVATVAGGWNSYAGGEGAAIGGGRWNDAGGYYSTIGGGQENRASGQRCAVAGGMKNQAIGDFSSMGGGSNNIASGVYATISGGHDNMANDSEDTIGGGVGNIAWGGGAVVAGGSRNVAANVASVGGGYANSAGGIAACIPGGLWNTADGNISMAAGRRAKALHDCAFVWADSTDVDFSSTSSNQFLIRASGGVGIGTTAPRFALDVNGKVKAGEHFILSAESGYEWWTGPFTDSSSWQITHRNMSDGSWFNALTILADGKVGIGTPTPVAALDVESGVGLYGVMAQSGNSVGRGVFAGGYVGVEATGTYGVYAHSAGGYGVSASTETGYGIYAIATGGGYTGWFDGTVVVNGTLQKAAGSFKIDHPLDPEHKYLSHSFVESPDMKNVYDGVATLDEKGAAIVTLPDWFEALNRDFRYQLTAIGAPGPNLHIGAEIVSNQFAIAGGSPGMKVSWQVTGIRQDAYANAHRIPVEEIKTAGESGLYLHPELFGQPAEKRVGLNPNTGHKLPSPPKAPELPKAASAPGQQCGTVPAEGK